MAESDLSAEVNATTVLPAPGAPSATIDTSVDVVVKWANNDDSSDGGIDVERSTKGDGYLSSAEARYKFETPTDGTIEDAVGANDGTPFGGTSATGELSTAIGLDGVDDYVELPLASFLEGRTSVTLAGWIYDDSSSITPFARFWSSGNNEFELFRDGSSNTDWNARVNTKNNRRRDIPVTIGSPDQFHHVALTYDGSVARVYVDGTEAVSEPFSGGLQSIGGEVYLGANKSPRDAGYLNGRIDDFRVWGSVLSGDQIQTLADNPNTKFGFSSFTSVTTSLPPSATSFTDTTVSSDERYEYRIERNTDHATATSKPAAIELPPGVSATVATSVSVGAEEQVAKPSKQATATANPAVAELIITLQTPSIATLTPTAVTTEVTSTATEQSRASVPTAKSTAEVAPTATEAARASVTTAKSTAEVAPTATEAARASVTTAKSTAIETKSRIFKFADVTAAATAPVAVSVPAPSTPAAALLTASPRAALTPRETTPNRRDLDGSSDTEAAYNLASDRVEYDEPTDEINYDTR